jgi:hypothetical protein
MGFMPVACGSGRGRREGPTPKGEPSAAWLVVVVSLVHAPRVFPHQGGSSGNHVASLSVERVTGIEPAFSAWEFA